MHELNLILAAVYYVIAALTIIHVVMDNRQPAKTMAWALVQRFFFFFEVDDLPNRLP